MWKGLLLIGLLFIGISPIYAQRSGGDTILIKQLLDSVSQKCDETNRSSSELDSAMQWSRQALTLSQALDGRTDLRSTYFQASSLTAIATCHFENKDNQRGEPALKTAFQYCVKEHYVEGEAFVYKTMADYLHVDTALLPGLHDSRGQLLRDYKKYPGAADPTTANPAVVQEAIAHAFRSMSNAYWQENRIDLAKEELLTAIEFGKTCIRPDTGPYNSLSYLFQYQGDMNNALFYALEGMKQLERRGNPEMNEWPYLTLGNIYFILKKPELCIDNLARAFALTKKKGKIPDGLYLKLIARAYISEGKTDSALTMLLSYEPVLSKFSSLNRELYYESLGICYEHQKKFDQAEKYYLECLPLIDKAMTMRDRLNLYTALASVYFETQQWSKLRVYAGKVVTDTSHALMPLQLDAYKYLSKADSATGDYLSALRHLNQYLTIKDSLFNIQVDAKTEEMRVKYETEKKDKALREARLFRDGLIVGALMLFALLALIYNRYLIKQRSNRLLEVLNRQQQKLIKEKEWLVKEIHHRVKNNLQIVISLLNAQSKFTDNPSGLHALKESRERIYAIALIHQKLYQFDDSTSINMQSYIQEMVAHLESGFMERGHILFQLEVGDIELDVTQGLPIGLILNEAITNAVKYAFSKNGVGRIRIILQKVDEQHLRLRIIDNGKGFPPDLDLLKNGSLGIQLIKLFSDQLEGKLQIIDNNGVEISLTFPQQLAGTQIG